MWTHYTKRTELIFASYFGTTEGYDSKQALNILNILC